MIVLEKQILEYVVDDAQNRYAEVEAITTKRRINGFVYARELLMFYADLNVNIEVALELARAEIESRQEIGA